MVDFDNYFSEIATFAVTLMSEIRNGRTILHNDKRSGDWSPCVSAYGADRDAVYPTYTQ